MRFRHLLLAGVFVAAAPATAIAAGPKYGTWGVDRRDMDTSVKPGDDFFSFAEGHWLKTADIQADKSRAGYT